MTISLFDYSVKIMSERVNKTLVLSQNVAISLSLALLIGGYIVTNEVRLAGVVNQLENHLTDPALHHNAIEEWNTHTKEVESRFATKQEVKFGMEKVELKLEQIVLELKKINK